MQRTVSQWGEVYQCRAVLNRLQRDRQVHRDGGGATSALGIHDRENFSARGFTTWFPSAGGQASKCVQQIGGRCGPFDVLSRSGSHRAHDQLGVGHTSYGKHG